MNRIPFSIKLSSLIGSNIELTPTAEELLVAEDCTRMCSDLFWLIEQVAADAGVITSDEIVFRAEEMPEASLEDARLLKSLASVARLGASITERLQTVIATLDDYSRRATDQIKELSND